MKPAPPHTFPTPNPGCLGQCLSPLLLGALVSAGTACQNGSRQGQPWTEPAPGAAPSQGGDSNLHPNPDQTGPLLPPYLRPRYHPVPWFPHPESGALRGHGPYLWPSEACCWQRPRCRRLQARFPRPCQAPVFSVIKH